MTEHEIIQALKNNKEAFGLMPEEMQEWARKHHWDMEMYYSDDSWLLFAEWDCNDRIRKYNTFRLRPDYPEEPDRIKLEIIEVGMMLRLKDDVNPHPYNPIYTEAPSFIPKEGYRFAGYRYKATNEELHLEPVLLRATEGEIIKISSVYCDLADWEVIFPTHAVYKKV